MATPIFDDLTAALNLCRDPRCAGNPESCDSCYPIASALAVYRGRAERAKRKAAKAEAELEKGRAFAERIQQAAMDRGGFDQGVEVDSATFVVQALEAAETEVIRLLTGLKWIRSRDCVCGGDGHPPTMCGRCIADTVVDPRRAGKDQGHE